MTQYICSKMFTDINMKFPYNSVKNCCKTKDINLTIDELKNNKNIFIENTDYLNRKSAMLFDNTFPDACDYCKKLEPNNWFRSSYNVYHDKNIIFTDDEKEKMYKGDRGHLFELVLSSACDLKCVYCGPKDSTSWAKETNQSKNVGDDEWKNLVLDQFVEYLKNKDFSHDPCYYFSFSGGEPTYNPETIILLEKLIKYIPPKKIRLQFSTNLNTKENIFNKYVNLIKKYSDVIWQFQCSIDCLEEQFEAIRYGAKWERVLNNLKILLSLDNVQVRLSPTLNIFSLPTLKEYLQFFAELFKKYDKPLNKRIGFNMVMETGLSIMQLPKDYTKQLDDAIQICVNEKLDYINHLKRISNIIGSQIQDNTYDDIVHCIQYFENKRPEIDWYKTFPHLNDVLKTLNPNMPNIEYQEDFIPPNARFYKNTV